MGELTGRGAGFCAGFNVPGYANPMAARGFGAGGGFGRGRGFLPRGAGGGRGWRNMFYATGLPGWARFGGYGVPYATQAGNPDPEQMRQFLRGQAEGLQSELDLIKKRLAELEEAATD